MGIQFLLSMETNLLQVMELPFAISTLMVDPDILLGATSGDPAVSLENNTNEKKEIIFQLSKLPINKYPEIKFLLVVSMMSYKHLQYTLALPNM